MERVQTPFFDLQKIWVQSGSVGIIFANVVRFWDVGPALAPFWAHVGPSKGHFVVVLAFVGQELGPYWACLAPVWAMLGHFWLLGIILGSY